MAPFWENSLRILGVLTPLLAALANLLLQRWGLLRKAKEIEVVEKRIQIVEWLIKQDLSNETKSQLKIHVADIAQHVIEEKRRHRTARETDVKRLRIWQRFLLAYTQPTIKASIYRGFFWFFLSVCVVGVLFLIPRVWRAEEIKVFGSDRLFFGLLFYLGIGLLFRAAALRQLKRFHPAYL